MRTPDIYNPDRIPECWLHPDARNRGVVALHPDTPPARPAVVTLVYSAAQMAKLGIPTAMTVRLCAAHAEDADPPAASFSAEAGVPCDFCCNGGGR